MVPTSLRGEVGKGVGGMPALGKREKGDKAKRKHHFPSSSKPVLL